MKKFLLLLLSLLSAFYISAKEKTNRTFNLKLSQDDIAVVSDDESKSPEENEFFHIYIKKIGDIQSVGLYADSDNYNDPDLYILRSPSALKQNKNESRLSNGKKNKYRMELNPNSLISSTVIKHDIFGECFHIVFPRRMYMGYVIQEQNECLFENGMTLNIRTYSKKGIDPAAAFENNKLILTVTDLNTEQTFKTVANKTEGTESKVVTTEGLTEKLTEEINSLKTNTFVQLIFAIDATASMKDDFIELRKKWLPVFEKQFAQFENIQVGIVFYKDYGDELRTKKLPGKVVPFSSSFTNFSRQIKNIEVSGGGDKEEAVYEALYLCATEFEWSQESVKKIILVGDAGAHSVLNPVFSKSSSQVLELIKSQKISADCILISEADTKNTNSQKIITKQEITPAMEQSVKELYAK